jgi:hypothetical protein
MPNAWNPRLVIKGGRWIFYLYCCQILTLESNRKDTNRWFKVVIMNCQILTVKGCLSWPLWASIAAAVMSINQKEPYRGMVKCQAIQLFTIQNSTVLDCLGF